MNAELRYRAYLNVRHDRFSIHQDAVTVENHAMGQETAPENPAASTRDGDLTPIARFGPEASGLFAALHADAFAHPWSEAAFERLLASSGVAGLVLHTGETPAGLAVIRSVAGESEVLTLGVIKALRRCGLARRLLESVQDEARKAGSARLFLEVSEINAPAIALYCAAGFQAAGRRRAYYRDGRDALVMALTL